MVEKVELQQWHTSNVWLNLTVAFLQGGLHRFTQACLGSTPEPIILVHLSLDAMHEK